MKNIKHEKLQEFFEKNDYMKKIYPNIQARDGLEVFCFEQFSGEYFDRSQKPILRISFSYNQSLPKGGYHMLEECIGCHKCYEVCPQKCIDINQKPVKIIHEYCLHCAKCKEICPKQVIVKI